MHKYIYSYALTYAYKGLSKSYLTCQKGDYNVQIVK